MSSPSDLVTCEWVVDRMETWIDGDLPPSETAVLRRHLGNCDTCTDTARRARAVVDELRGLPELAPPGGLLPRPRTATQSGENGPRARSRWTRHRWRLAAAAALIVGASAVFVTHAPTSPDPTHIDRASLEVRYALGIVARANRAAGREVGDTLNQGLPVEHAASRIGRILEHARQHRPVELDVHGG